MNLSIKISFFIFVVIFKLSAVELNSARVTGGILNFYQQTSLANSSWPEDNWPNKNWIKRNWQTENLKISEFDKEGYVVRERIGEDDGRHYFIKVSEVNIVVESAAGQHKLEFEDAENIFIGGGHFSACLYETIRDIVRGVNS